MMISVPDPQFPKSLSLSIPRSQSLPVLKSLGLILLLLIIFNAAGLSQEKAPDFSGKTLNGKEIKLSDYQGKVVLIDFWASWCPPCREEMPELIKFYKSHNNNDFELIAVNIDEKSSNMEQFLGKLFPEPQFPIIVDDHQQIPPLFNIEAMPTTIFIDKKGDIRFRHDGFKEDYVNDFNNELSQLLKEKS
jgi:thiol-disulfide isomerase/thioredoxin